MSFPVPQQSPALAPVRRCLGDTWVFPFSYVQADGVTPVDLSSYDMSAELLPPGASLTPVATLATTSDSTTDLAQGTFTFVYDSSSLPAPSTATSGTSQSVYRLRVIRASLGQHVTIGVLYVLAWVP